ncbi:MAG: hypothetical protein JMDDDDMK_01115 [Acidobacteria bacterium]|nr:hypothetical protein [Acidobacteriota bacterium]
MKQGRIPGINTRKRIRGDKTIRRKIFDLCEQIVRACSPQKIILFGSYAYGQPNEDSDVDLLVIMPFKCSPHQQAFNIRMKITPPMPMDLLVRTPEHVEERIRMGDFFMQEITEQGKVLYEADYAGVGK